MFKEKIFVVGTLGATERTVDMLTEKENSVFVSYSDLYSSKEKIASNAKVYFGFPYELWDELVEVKDVLYGCEGYGNAIKKLASTLEEQLCIRFPSAKYVNKPSSILIERDKKLAKKIVQDEGMLVAQDIPKNIDAVLESVHNGDPVYVKARYGSMGKGISYFSENKWTTNFNYDSKKGTIRNHQGDKNWQEQDITGDLEFLEKILEKDVVVEKAIRNPIVNGLKFDFRVHSIYGDAKSNLSYARLSNNSSITNISQGGSYLSFEKMKDYVPEKYLVKALGLIEKASLALNFNYAGGDVLFQGDGFEPVFLEANSFPGLSAQPEKFKKDVVDNLYKKIMGENISERIDNKSRIELY